jgi:DNA (cytosine-5)-methyltransferase 1
MADMTSATKKKTAIDLFCGCGGMSLGVARAGFNIAVSVDTDVRASKAHEKNFPKSVHLSKDIALIAGMELLQAGGLGLGQLDLLVGGPPCQGFSSIGKRKLDDERNSLIGHFFRLVKETKPKAFVMENVPGLLNEQNKHLLDTAVALISDEYHVLNPQKLRACEVGAPTVRTRVFVVGFQKKLKLPKNQNFWTSVAENAEVAPLVRDALDGLPIDIAPDPQPRNAGRRVVHVSRAGSFFERISGNIPEGVGDPDVLKTYQTRKLVSGCIGTMHSPELAERYANLSYGAADKKTKSVRLDPAGYCPTLRAGTGPEKGSFQAVRPIHYLRPRVITPREAARLQGFPDWFEFDSTKWHSFRQIGNSVSPIVAEVVAHSVLEYLKRAQ